MAIPPVETTKWLALLTASLMLTTFGTTLPNRFKQLRSPRSHNGLRLFNECLAHSHLALFNYFLALGITGPISHPVAKVLLLPLSVVSSYFYVSGVAAMTELDAALRRTHRCAGDTCQTRMGLAAVISVSARNLVTTVTLFGAAVYYALTAGG